MRDAAYSSTSRYKFADELIGDNKETYLDLPNHQHFDPTVTAWHEVQHHEINRLDVLSFTYYKRVDYWWVIAEANQILDPFNVPQGLMLKIPTINDIFSEEGLL